MSDVFITYSRVDKDFVHSLSAALEKAGRAAWVDWEDIPPTAEWLQEIYAGIEAADAYLFVLSPESINSRVCRLELQHAIQNHKRLVPLLYRPVNRNSVPEPLGDIHWIFFQAEQDFEASFQTLLVSLDTDLEWVRRHTRLQVRGLEWQNNRRNDSFLLRGQDLREAEDWLAQGTIKEPRATSLQVEYINASRMAETRRRRILLGASAAALLVIVVLVAGPSVYRGALRWAAWQRSPLVEIPPAEAVVFSSKGDTANPGNAGSLVGEMKGFEIEKYEVSNANYRRCYRAGACSAPADQGRFLEEDWSEHPVVFVSAFQAMDYCRWLGRRLPTEFEWARAAYGVEDRLFPWGEPLPDPQLVNFDFSTTQPGSTRPVEDYQQGATPAPESIYNLVGNVYEWTSTAFQETFPFRLAEQVEWRGDLTQAPAALSVRGGSWLTIPRVSTRPGGRKAMAYEERIRVSPREQEKDIGYRCAR